MIDNFPDIFRRNLLSKTEGVSERTARPPISESAPTRRMPKFFDKNNILDLVRRKKYGRAVKLIKDNKINAFSLFNGVNLFGNVYDRLPFVAAALALSSDKPKNAKTIYDRVNDVIANVFIPSGINSANMFDAKLESNGGYNDVLSFVFTHDGQIKPSKYDEESDLNMLILLNSLLDDGYTLNNSDGIVRYIMDNDLVSSLKKLAESGIYSPNADDIGRFSIKPMSNVWKYVSFAAPHPFRFHSPEMEFDDKGKFCGGTIYRSLQDVGYDISKPEKEFKVHISIPFMVKDFIEGAKSRYANEGESFSNESDTNFGDGSEFMDAVNALKRISSDYGKYIRSEDIGRKSEDERIKYMTELVKSANSNIEKMQNGFNYIMGNVGFPKVILLMNNELKDDDSKILYKASPFMREIWNSVKLMK